jgi:hypothetical protein
MAAQAARGKAGPLLLLRARYEISHFSSLENNPSNATFKSTALDPTGPRGLSLTKWPQSSHQPLPLVQAIEKGRGDPPVTWGEGAQVVSSSCDSEP